MHSIKDEGNGRILDLEVTHDIPDLKFGMKLSIEYSTLFPTSLSNQISPADCLLVS